MPTSCSTAAAHSSSRSSASPGCSPASASASQISSARRTTCAVCAGSAWYWAARLRTEEARTSASSGGSWPASSSSKNAPSRRPASVTSSASNPPTSITVWTTTAPARIRSPRSGLMPATRLRCSGDIPASRSTSASSSPRSRRKPWTPYQGRPRSIITAAARLRTVPPIPASAAVRVAQPLRVGQLPAHVLPQRLEVLGLDALGGEEALRRDDRAEPPGARIARRAIDDVRELHRAAADVERDAVGQRRRVDHGEVAVAGLLLAREHLDVEPGALAGGAHERLAVRRLADRRGRQRPHPLDARRAAEVGEQVDRLERAPHRLGLERPAGLLVLADPHRLVDLVGPLPPVLGVGEDDEAERVRPEIDDGEPLLHAVNGMRCASRGVVEGPACTSTACIEGGSEVPVAVRGERVNVGRSRLRRVVPTLGIHNDVNVGSTRPRRALPALTAYISPSTPHEASIRPGVRRCPAIRPPFEPSLDASRKRTPRPTAGSRAAAYPERSISSTR